MKKTLFAMAALALCGAAVAETKTYYAKDFVGQNFDYNVYGNGNEVVFNVNQPATLNKFDVYHASSGTLNFVGASTLSVTSSVDFGVGNDGGTLAITGDNDAKIYWGESLTSSAEEVKTLTLVSTTGSLIAFGSFSFEGLTESGSITLGNATVDYVGYHKVANIGAAKALITGDNKIALVTITDTGKGLYLVGKATATTPEPATATLSLMALAGLASRRRRK